jgi:hypothetical protein
MVLTVSFALSLVIGLFVTVAGGIASANLTPASRRQDHTTSPSARSAHRQARARVHRIPPRGRDDRDRPSLGRDGAGYESDLGEARRKIFLQTGLDRKSTNGVICSTGNQFDIIHCARRLRL